MFLLQDSLMQYQVMYHPEKSSVTTVLFVLFTKKKRSITTRFYKPEPAVNYYESSCNSALLSSTAAVVILTAGVACLIHLGFLPALWSFPLSLYLLEISISVSENALAQPC